MKFPLDANLSPRLAEVLSDAGFATTHVVDVDLADASDQAIFDFAAAGQFVATNCMMKLATLEAL